MTELFLTSFRIIGVVLRLQYAFYELPLPE